MEQTNFMVRVSCMTFNHAPYIVDAMNGFTMQQTNFPFVCTIIDDASTDGEPEVIRQYLHVHFDLENKGIVSFEETDDYTLTFARHNENHNCYFAVFFLKYNHYKKKSKAQYVARWADNSKYTALCEGDDYWIDDKKLQKQVDYLESNDDVGLVYSDINRFVEKDNAFEQRAFFESKKIIIQNTHKDFILHSWFLAPCTWVYRKELRKSVPNLDSNCFKGDTLLLLSISAISKVVFMSDTMAVYRVRPVSASHFLTRNQERLFWEKNKNTRSFFARKQALGFRLKYWLQISKECRPSFRREITQTPKWTLKVLKEFIDVVL